MKIFLTINLLCFCVIGFTQENIIKTTKDYIENNYNEQVHELLFVNVAKQKMYHIKNQDIIKIYIVSTSAYGIGNEAGSNKTPQGLHKVKQKYGNNTPINGRMIVFYGEIATIYSDTTKSKTDDITSRIMWLEGLEDGINKGEGIDSYERYIYIHGTSEEGRLGNSTSHGCIRMKNKDVIELYEKIRIGTLVLIL